MLELLALLLPLAAASGWYMARRHYLSAPHPLTSRFPPYFKDLDKLLDERANKAVNIVEELLEQNPSAIETQISLGNLYRRQGEVEKAISLHEKLLENPGLQENQRNDAYRELGMDYMKAGLLDRAESIFKALTATAHRPQALHQLLHIYQQEKDWFGAMNCALELKRLTGTTPKGESEAQFLVELAKEAQTKGDISLARDYIARALKTESTNIRAMLLQAELDIGDGQYADTLSELTRVSMEQTEYFPIILPLIKICHQNLNDGAGYRHYLDQVYRRCGLVDAALALSEEIDCVEGCDKAIEYLLQVLHAHPSLKGLALLFRMQTQMQASLEPERMMEIGHILKTLAPDGQHHTCSQCGFDGVVQYWRCPSCQHWSTIKPVTH